ncbi:hypothetical protein ACPOL_0940 [Acidisarcina polymorpha]|uniref:Uncharacterized protein n=1 Tax=Acidisarcina polymorpha TaxID=2211140 RepID=A0A2Z5FTY8_9BACT|nr:hypothetical protein ACPOL_0940 [Acidisarcina polymorpha]
MYARQRPEIDNTTARVPCFSAKSCARESVDIFAFRSPYTVCKGEMRKANEREAEERMRDREPVLTFFFILFT